MTTSVNEQFRDAGVFRAIKLAIVSVCRGAAKAVIGTEAYIDAYGTFGEYVNAEAQAFTDEAKLKRAQRLRELEAADDMPRLTDKAA